MNQVYVFTPHRGPFFIYETPKLNSYKQNTLIKQSKGLNGMMGPTTDIDKQVPTF